MNIIFDYNYEIILSSIVATREYILYIIWTHTPALYDIFFD